MKPSSDVIELSYRDTSGERIKELYADCDIAAVRAKYLLRTGYYDDVLLRRNPPCYKYCLIYTTKEGVTETKLYFSKSVALCKIRQLMSKGIVDCNRRPWTIEEIDDVEEQI